jgi:hypothetical protein
MHASSLLRSMFALALLAGPPLPEAFLRLPADIRDKATLVLSGKYEVGRGPDEPLPNGGHRWARLQGFTVATVYRGSLRAEYVGLEFAYPPNTWADGLSLVPGRDYLLVLRPSDESWKVLRTPGRTHDYRDVLSKAEVLALVALREEAAQ